MITSKLYLLHIFIKVLKVYGLELTRLFVFLYFSIVDFAFLTNSPISSTDEFSYIVFSLTGHNSDKSGYISNYGAYRSFTVAPVLYLSTDTVLTGNGSIENMYQIIN